MTKTTNWQVGDRFRLLDVSNILCGEDRKNGDVLTVAGTFNGTEPYSECGLVINDHELFYIEKVAPIAPGPHQAVREYFDELVDREEQMEAAGMHGGQHRQGWLSVKRTLDILGIKVAGVNE